MEFDIEQLKESFGGDVSSDTLLQVKMMVESFVDDKVHSLSTQLAEKEKELAFVTECAEKYSESIKEELLEKGEAYGRFLMEKAESYGEYLTENADKYGEFLMEKAEAYADSKVEVLTEKLDSYAQHVVESFIKENTEKLVEHSEYLKGKKLLESLKTAFEENMYPLNESHAIAKMEARVKETNKQYNALFEEVDQLRKQNLGFAKQQILEKYVGDLSTLQKDKIQRVTESITKLPEYEKAVKMLVEDFEYKNAQPATKLGDSVKADKQDFTLTESKFEYQQPQSSTYHEDDMESYVSWMEKSKV